MNFLKRNQIAFWIMILFTVLNIAIMAGFFIFTGRDKAPEACCPPQEMQRKAFREELNLTEEQTARVQEINENYTKEAGFISDSIKIFREQILSEMEKPNPDSLLITTSIENIARLQMEIQHKNIAQYMALKKVCTPAQAQRLSALYRDLYGCPMKNQGNQNRHQHRHGQDTSGQCCGN